MLNLLRKLRLLSLPVIMMFAVVALPPQAAYAGIVGTETVLAEQAVLERAELLSLIDRSDVQEQLIAHGVSPEQAVERVAGLTDEEVLELAERMDSLPAGGAVVLLLVVVIILLLIR